jgi:hypothetical protein
MNERLQQHLIELRAEVMALYAFADAMREQAFEQWQRDTVYPAAVNRWIEECGR